MRTLSLAPAAFEIVDGECWPNFSGTCNVAVAAAGLTALSNPTEFGFLIPTAGCGQLRAVLRLATTIYGFH